MLNLSQFSLVTDFFRLIQHKLNKILYIMLPVQSSLVCSKSEVILCLDDGPLTMSSFFTWCPLSTPLPFSSWSYTIALFDATQCRFVRNLVSITMALLRPVCVKQGLKGKQIEMQMNQGQFHLHTTVRAVNDVLSQSIPLELSRSIPIY